MTIGQLAQKSGVSARSLRHYEQIGLLEPARRESSGYRSYRESDLARVQQIRRLIDLGLSLREVGRVLTSGALCPRRLVDLQLSRVEAEVDKLTTLRGRLLRLRDSLEAGGDPTRDDLLTTLEAMNMLEKQEEMDPILLELGQELLPLCYPSSENCLLPGIQQVRARLKEAGIYLPGVRVKDAEALPGQTYRLTLLQTVKAERRVPPDQLLASGDPGQVAGLGQREQFPGVPGWGVWIDPSRQPEAETRGCRVRGPVEVITGHLFQVFQDNRAQLKLLAPRGG